MQNLSNTSKRTLAQAIASHVTAIQRELRTNSSEEAKEHAGKLAYETLSLINEIERTSILDIPEVVREDLDQLIAPFMPPAPENRAKMLYHWASDSRCFISSLRSFFASHPLREPSELLFEFVDPFNRPLRPEIVEVMTTCLAEQRDVPDFTVTSNDRGGRECEFTVTIAYN